MKDFVHLHVHSEYSLLDGAIKLKDLFERAKELDYKAIALTDHGNMFGALEFYKLAKEYQIKPIIGMEVYIAEDSRFKKESQESIFHGILLAKNTTGYKNLLKLASLAYIEGFYYKPRIDLELLKKYHEGIIYLSGCLKSQIAYFILNHQKDKIRRKLLELKDIYGEDFYLELLNHGLEEEEKVNKTLLEFSSLYDIKVVATNDVHYINKEHAFSHDILLCIQTNKTYKQKDRLKFPNSEFYLKSKKQMINLFQDIPQSIENTIKISESCCVDIELGKVHLPIYNKDSPMLLRKLALDGAKKRFKNISTNIRQRLDYELSVIEKMGFCDYFLIVYDIVKYAKDNHIPVGPGRGSAAGSLIAYCLGITNINPIEYNLLFERFLNPERITLPDIDIDFADDKRNEIISYIRKKYGNDKVANIITFGTMQARAVVRDVGRAFGLAYSEVDRIAKAIWDSKLSLSDIERDSNFQRLIDSPEKKKLIEVAKVLEGQVRHASTHAAGIVIADKPLWELVPLYKDSKEGIISTQYSMTNIEDLGLLKMDILGLKTLSVIDNTLKLIKQRYNKEIDLDNISLEDKPTYELLSKGETIGIFQLESKGMRDLLKTISPSSFKELIAILALYRPGPIQSGMVDEFIRAKTTRRISYPHPLLEEILKETYGVVIYQEQVMQIAEKLANFSLAQADMLRKAMSKKIKEKMQELQEAFITGATKHSKLSEAQAKEIFFLLAKFAEYGFNKSHSAAYALIAYQTAYLKANYKLEFLCSLLSSEMQDQEKLNFYITECDRLKIIVIPPDINKSYFSFTIEDNNRLRFGLGGIKNVGYSAISKIVENRKLMGEYRSLFDFCQRQDLRVVNKKTIESLIKCGAFDSIVKNRAQLLSALEHTIELASKLKKSKDSYQLGLFEEDASWLIKKEDIKLPDLPEFPQDVIERFELEYLGVYLSKRQEELNKALHISIFADIYGDELYKLKTVLQNHPGYSQVYLHIFSKENKNKKEKIIKLPDTFLVSIDDELLHKLEILLKDVKLEVVTI